jgi:peptide deformylase
VLRRKTQRVQRIDGSVQRLIDDLTETMYAENGVGLAANQVGVPLRICVIRIPEEEMVRVLINPEMVVRRGDLELDEGCLSIPDYRGKVHRALHVRVRAQDRDGNAIRIKAEDSLLAQALQHEIDHLNGILYIDHLVSKDAIWKLSDEEPTEEPSTSSETSPP